MSNDSPHPIRWDFTPAELWADGVVHALGTALAALASAIFVVAIVGEATPGEIVAVAVYLATLILSLGISAAYNLWPVGRRKWLLRRFDHSAIFLLIAGTYTPFMVESGTWWLLGGVWAMAAFGILLKLLKPGRFDRLAILMYLGMGWSGVVAWDALAAHLQPTIMWLILAGGVIYSLGVVFHVWERLRFQNAIWHGFVLAGAGTHFAAVWVCVALETA